MSEKVNYFAQAARRDKDQKNAIVEQLSVTPIKQAGSATEKQPKSKTEQHNDVRLGITIDAALNKKLQSFVCMSKCEGKFETNTVCKVIRLALNEYFANQL